MPTILIAGDYCPSCRVVDEIAKGNYGMVFDEVKAVSADFKIVNFECAVAGLDDTPIKKCGPNLKCSEKSVDAIKYAGFDCVTLANNHFGDYGQTGVEKTISKLKQEGLVYVGGGATLQEAQRTLYQRIEGDMVAFINCCEHEFSIATEQRGGSNPLNPIRQWYAIREAKENADYVLVIVHGGPEQYELPLNRMVETYRFFIDAGADAVINHHQHCMSGYEEYKGKPIFYGLGNFCFDWNQKELKNWHKGYMVRLNMDKDCINYELCPYYQCYQTPKVELLTEQTDVDAFNVKIEELNAIILSTENLCEANEKYFNKMEGNYLSALEPYQSKLTQVLFEKGLLPSFIKGRKRYRLYDFVSCESHYDRLLSALKSKI